MADINGDRIIEAARSTEILRPPRQTLSSFGITNIYYYLVTEPAYAELVAETDETVIREGRVVAERPRIVTPYYLSRLEGFSPDARRYFNTLLQTHGADTPGIFYTYKNEPGNLSIVSDKLEAVVARLNADIDKRGDPLTSIIKAQDELWDVSLLRFIYEVTRNSLKTNISQMGERKLLDVDSSGLPLEARLRIEDLFRMAAKGGLEPSVLERELNHWGVFEEYQDRFFALFRGRKA